LKLSKNEYPKLRRFQVYVPSLKMDKSLDVISEVLHFNNYKKILYNPNREIVEHCHPILVTF